MLKIKFNQCNYKNPCICTIVYCCLFIFRLRLQHNLIIEVLTFNNSELFLKTS